MSTICIYASISSIINCLEHSHNKYNYIIALVFFALITPSIYAGTFPIQCPSPSEMQRALTQEYIQINKDKEKNAYKAFSTTPQTLGTNNVWDIEVKPVHVKNLIPNSGNVETDPIARANNLILPHINPNEAPSIVSNCEEFICKYHIDNHPDTVPTATLSYSSR